MNDQTILQISSLADGLPIFKALSAPSRIQILTLLSQGEQKNLNDLAQALGLTNSAVSLHVKCLEEAGLITIQTGAGKHGSMKLCQPVYDTMVFHLREDSKTERLFYEDTISVGCYNRCLIRPTCGIATADHNIGEFDNPKYFQFPEHFLASILWFGSGFVEYSLPNHLIPGQTPKEISLSFEISSECPGYNEDYPSDLEFFLNDINLGCWVSPGDFGARRGRFTPDWWSRNCNQYGLLKTLTVNSKGTFIDRGRKLSDVTIEDLCITYRSNLTFRFQVFPDAVNCGGFTIFGKDFGDYQQDIEFRIYYS